MLLPDTISIKINKVSTSLIHLSVFFIYLVTSFPFIICMHFNLLSSRW